jgi:hypothetical protein
MWGLHGQLPGEPGDPAFSPRQMIKRVLMDKDDTILHGRELWACLTCARCSVRCPVGIDFPEFARAYRGLARKEGNLPQLSHQGTLQSIMTLQTKNIKQRRTVWASEVGKFKASGDLFYFVGCAPYFDAALKYGSTALKAARSVLMLFNRMGIEPVIWYEDTKECIVKQLPVDLVILSTACEPGPATKQLSELFGVEINAFGFFKTSSAQPLDTTRPGVFVCGCAQAPMDIPESVAQSSSAAARAAQVLSSGVAMRLAS